MRDQGVLITCPHRRRPGRFWRRYGPGAHYRTNATAAASDPAPDFLASGLQGTSTHRFHTSAYIAGPDTLEGLDVIAVNDEEVGAFWSFGVY
ncbi:hypothetical protein GCM10010266_68560 [Streptomyces griseomycini]|uniref:hypothetical protein n=1 Tax=Streptomyces griseomycini TaxID=66895 RepID=UPI0019CC6B89|nr:hypothetical protein [Streptomyces griseomycini]GGQ35357.1 hypothetical protein GCM10010266_68560 [Streptomyces griseomycini]